MDDYYSFIKKVYKDIGVDLSLYKEKQMKRRLTSLRERRGFKSFTDYYEGFKQDQDLKKEFLNRITINVSHFYRNYKRWEVLKKQILPDLIKQKSKIKIWSAACSTGEEPYTAAMLLSDFFELNQISILATDIDEEALEQAKVGAYSKRSLDETPKDKIEKFFSEHNSTYLISDELKNIVTFKKHNLLEDPYDGHFDLIICRNVLIYFTEEAKLKVYQNFNQSLSKDGILFVGSTEQLFKPLEHHFKPVNTFFYKKF